MKFKAYLSDDGINLLEKRILPALDKIGKISHLYLTPDHLFFLHHLLSADALHSVAQFHRHSLFHDYRISSTFSNRIAFSLDLSLLHRALRSILTIYAQSRDLNSNGLLIKLVKKLPPHSTHPTPFLTFEAKGHRSAVVHDVPISKPLSHADLQDLQTALDNAQEMPATLVRAPELNSLQNFVDRMKHVGDVIGVSISKYSDLCEVTGMRTSNIKSIGNKWRGPHPIYMRFIPIILSMWDGHLEQIEFTGTDNILNTSTSSDTMLRQDEDIQLKTNW